jgi:predicted acyltransferase
MAESTSKRVLSVDALRGFDMFWIIGADALFLSLLGHVDHPWSRQLAMQLEHAEWEGFRFYDLIFPLFLFLVGCAIPYSLEKYRSNPSEVYARITRRVIALILLGLLANGILQFDWQNLRVAGILQRIGLCYGAAALIYLHSGPRLQWLVFGFILLAYWAVLAWIPTPDGIAGDLSAESNLAGWLDRQLLPGRIPEKYYGYGDNEGILSTLPAIGTVLSGIMTAHLLRSSMAELWKVLGMLVAGGACIAVGFAWSPWFPIIKNLWTSSFVLVATGYSLLLLAAFYWLIDVMGFRRWAFAFTLIGLNAITIYIAQRFIDFDHTANYFLGGLAAAAGSWSTTVLLAGSLAAKILFLWFLYRQRLFLRV